MPQVLTVTSKPDESPEKFASRIAHEMTSFFDQAAENTDEPAQESPDKPTDETAEPETESG